MSRINEILASNITKAVGTMTTAYLFALLAFISFPAAIHSHDPIIMVGWVAQTFLQLVLLPIIIVGQNLQAQKHDELTAHVKLVHKHIKEIHTHLNVKSSIT